MVLVQKWPFFPGFFLGFVGQENVFYDILERKNAFLGYKRRSSKSRKIDIFPKGLAHGFGLRIAVFPTFFFRQYRPGNFFYDVLERKDDFLEYKYQKFKKVKN